MNAKPRVLFTAAYGPNHLGWGEDMYDLAAARLARGHGAFQITSHMHYYGLFLIAENITHPSTVLENPHWDEFDRELDEGYDYVAFQLKSLHTPKIARMMKRVREKCPDAKIIMGGYGVSALGYPVPGDTNGDAEYIRENADYLCREEGVRFMRRILGDEPVERPITQKHLPFCGMSLPGLEFASPHAPMILVSLGCPNGCDFCNTSAFFHQKKIYVSEPEEVYRHILHNQDRLGFHDIFCILFDEDFFINKEYVEELGKLLRKDRKTWGVNYFTFGSTRSLSQFTAEELKYNGLGSVWVGVESFMSDQVTSSDYYSKRRGEDIKQLFADLHSHNIQTIGSLVLGFDFHTPENLKQDIDQFVELKTMLYQISPLTPCPGTPLYERIVEEGRLKDTYKWEDFHLWKDDAFELKNFKPGEIKKFFDYAHDKIANETGPQPLQALESALDTYQTYKDKPGEFNAYQADRSKLMAKGAMSYIESILKLHASDKVKERARSLEKRFKREIGSMPLYSAAASKFIKSRIKKNFKKLDNPIVSDPPPRWSYYNTFDDRVWVKKGRKQKKPVVYGKSPIAHVSAVIQKFI